MVGFRWPVRLLSVATEAAPRSAILLELRHGGVQAAAGVSAGTVYRLLKSLPSWLQHLRGNTECLITCASVQNILLALAADLGNDGWLR